MMQETVGKPKTALMEDHDIASHDNEEFLKKVKLAERCRELMTEANSAKSLTTLLETTREVYHTAGANGISIEAITCTPEEFVQRKNTFQL